ncbi:MAG: Yip1 family protein [Promethearchaeota archaeon]
MSSEDSSSKQKAINEVILRNYPKVIFFYPLLIVSFICWIIQAIAGPDNLISTLGAIWFIVFFLNLFVIAFDFNSTKFFILILAIVVVILLVIFLILPNVSIDTEKVKTIEVNMGLSANFYLIMTLILGIILLFVVIAARFDYYKIERNEIYHKSGIIGAAERWPVKGLRIHKEIPDVFEFLALRAGSITLMPSKEKVIALNTVLNINKKAEQIDYLLSYIRVEVDDNV